ncbi:hypothetical protein CGMCC3_g17883 [Colletotrichum fructicola]|uniref:Uncharacterized protein n=1 Tax=Colletotrichum fructicola (strain Nara gc5) TaxID=1213859 RepID=A0A7J6IES5_COLFN|nr:uncharacterized protein CGMCC3_g17883 [Colletotrichum fructicola]KAE9565937.1 hypothetical protein CGMCC3_g17883 [Colletotrichum fructicola]KAF4474918.1 hypothetical protein CGGC5_v016000 [Colletotrichum fructicola Nara gc5]KAF4881344.1 hypothetical protein CGCFRS4_v015650 [Colletotrichum fructicola]
MGLTGYRTPFYSPSIGVTSFPRDEICVMLGSSLDMAVRNETSRRMQSCMTAVVSAGCVGSIYHAAVYGDHDLAGHDCSGEYCFGFATPSPPSAFGCCDT